MPARRDARGPAARAHDDRRALHSPHPAALRADAAAEDPGVARQSPRHLDPPKLPRRIPVPVRALLASAAAGQCAGRWHTWRPGSASAPHGCAAVAQRPLAGAPHCAVWHARMPLVHGPARPPQRGVHGHRPLCRCGLPHCPCCGAARRQQTRARAPVPQVGSSAGHHQPWRGAPQRAGAGAGPAARVGRRRQPQQGQRPVCPGAREHRQRHHCLRGRGHRG
mmetsp:Transcript_1512/g.3874  ORF Transcript_1512/g.3874 Transcript_1512/m.3874 type:complete len:222 (+) Transcript_1512:402-1067(+)